MTLKIEFIINVDLKDFPAFYDEEEDKMIINLTNPVYLLEEVIEDIINIASIHEVIHKVCPECSEEQVRTLVALIYKELRYG